MAVEEEIMDKDRVVGSAKVVKGKIKAAVGNAKLESEGKARGRRSVDCILARKSRLLTLRVRRKS